MTVRRIYAVCELIPSATEGGAPIMRHHLIRATSQAAAVRAVAAPRFTATIPSAEDLVSHTIAGVRVVDAGDAE